MYVLHKFCKFIFWVCHSAKSEQNLTIDLILEIGMYIYKFDLFMSPTVPMEYESKKDNRLSSLVLPVT